MSIFLYIFIKIFPLFSLGILIMINLKLFIDIFQWIISLFNSIQIHPQTKMIKEGPLDPRWIEEDGKFYFNFDYPIFKNENLNEIYSLEEVFNVIKLNDQEFLKGKNLIQDFEEILVEYRRALYDSKISKDFEVYYQQRSIQDIEKEEENLNEIIKEYFEAPMRKDELYRNINKLKFNDYDDDPLFLYQGDNDFKQKNTNLPKLKILSKRTFLDREERRKILLSEYKYPFIESERIGSIFRKFQTNK